MLKLMLIAATAATVATCGSAVAEPAPATAVAGAMCGERGALVGLLRQQYAEEQEEVSLHSEQALVELFASEKGTWSILLSTPNGVSCVVAAGKGLSLQARS